MRWNWQLPDWPDFSFDAERIRASEEQFLKGSGVVIGALADIVGKLDEWTYTWQHTADGRGRLYQPQSGFRGSIELIGWDALLGDARARNQAFFDRAGISGKSYFSPD